MKEITLALLGDVSLNGFWSDPSHDPWGPNLANWIRSHDAVLLNLESPVEGTNGENLLKLPRLRTTADAVRRLQELGPTVIGLGNNHVADQLQDGLRRTIAAVKDAGALPTGAARSEREARRPALFVLGGLQISVLCYVASDTHPNIPPDSDIFINPLDVKRIEDDIRRERAAGRFVIVSLHWGREFESYPTPTQRRTAARMMAAGASVVWGHHTHACQGWERMGRGLVFYSMGNSVFDDVVGMSLPWDKKGRRSLIASLGVEVPTGHIRHLRVRMVERPHVRAVPIPMSQAATRRLCEPLRVPAYPIFHLFYRFYCVFPRVHQYFFGPGRNALDQARCLPARLWDAWCGAMPLAIRDESPDVK